VAFSGRLWQVPPIAAATRRPTAAVFIVALTIRLIMGASILMAGVVTRFAPDARHYRNIIRAKLSGQDDLIPESSQNIYNASWSFLKPVEWVAWSADAVEPVAIVFTAIAGALLAALTCRLLLGHTRVAAAITGGLIVAIMPSQVLWSSMLLKDAYIAAAIAGLALTLRWWCRQTSTAGFIAGIGIVAALLLYISRIRAHTLVAVLIGLVLALLIAAPNRRLLRTGIALGLLLVIPVTANAGVGGTQVLSNLESGMENMRIRLGRDATTAVIEIPEPPQQAGRPRPQRVDLPNNMPMPASRSDWIDDLNYLPSGIKVMTLDPMPWHLGTSRSLIPAFAEHLIWYPLLALAGIGIVTRRRWTIDLAFSALILGGLIAMWSLTEGNFGTAFRHRTEFVWIVVIFAVLGFEHLRRYRSLRRNFDEPIDEAAGRLVDV